VAVTPDGRTVVVANNVADSVSVIDTASNPVIGSPIPVGPGPVNDYMGHDSPDRGFSVSELFTPCCLSPGPMLHR